jgi:lysophospholipase L1-like esterase
MPAHTRLFLLLCIIVASVGCDKTNEEGSSVAPIITTTDKKYLALGDSYTIGQGVTAPESFPVQTKNWLAVNSINMMPPDIIATTGWTTLDLMDAINTRKPSSDYDVVSLLIGVNDQYQRRDTIGYRNNFSNLLYKAIQLAKGRRERVFVLSIPDYSVTPFARFSDTALIRKQIDWFNAINKEVTLQNFCKYLDITPSTREAKNDPSLIAGDGLHPSGKEYYKWAERLGLLMKEAL